MLLGKMGQLIPASKCHASFLLTNGYINLLTNKHALLLVTQMANKPNRKQKKYLKLMVLRPYSQSPTYERAECCPDSGFFLLQANNACLELATLKSC